jgi:hypothetical protein
MTQLTPYKIALRSALSMGATVQEARRLAREYCRERGYSWAILRKAKGVQQCAS